MERHNFYAVSRIGLMRKTLFRFALCVLFLFSGVLIHAQTITSVSVRGLKRTKPHVAEYPLQKFIGRDGMRLDFNEVHAAIVSTGILEPLSIGVELTPDRETLILVVDVREKWALFPLPMFAMDSNGDIQGGGSLIDANAFGLNDTFAVTGIYGSTGWLASMLYRYTPDRKHLPGWTVMGMYGKRDQQDTDQHNAELRNYKQRIILGSLGIQYPVTEDLTASASVSLRRQDVNDGESPREVPDRGIFAGSIEPSLEISQSHWDGFLLSQQRASLSYAFMLPSDNSPLHTISVQANYEWSLVPGFKAGVRGGMHYAPYAPPILESTASTVDITILPKSFSAQHFAGASLELEKYLYKFSQGTLAVLASYQAVYSYGPILEDQFDHGVSASVNFYLSRIAIPALGFGVSYNVARNEYISAFNIGLSF
jgi:outer membrane protein assembly factor BamA